MFINPQRTCAARVTVVVLCVCLFVCLFVTDYSRTAGYMYEVASYPGRFVGGGKTAWYRLFAHARNTPRIVGYRICT